MKRFASLCALAILAAVVGLLAATSQATTTWTNSSGVSIATATTQWETGPTAATSGIAIDGSGTSGTSLEGRPATTWVVTVVMHLTVNVSGDAGIYDPAGAGDASVNDAGINTFFSGAQLQCWLYDNATATWNRYQKGDLSLPVGATRATLDVPALPKVNRLAYVAAGTGVPVKIYISGR